MLSSWGVERREEGKGRKKEKRVVGRTGQRGSRIERRREKDRRVTWERRLRNSTGLASGRSDLAIGGSRPYGVRAHRNSGQGDLFRINWNEPRSSISNNTAEGWERGTLRGTAHLPILSPRVHVANSGPHASRFLSSTSIKPEASEPQRTRKTSAMVPCTTILRQLGLWIESTKNSDQTGPRHRNATTRRSRTPQSPSRRVSSEAPRDPGVGCRASETDMNRRIFRSRSLTSPRSSQRLSLFLDRFLLLVFSLPYLVLLIFVSSGLLMSLLLSYSVSVLYHLEPPAMIYLDNAATSFPKPESVYQTLDRFARTSLANPGRSRASGWRWTRSG